MAGVFNPFRRVYIDYAFRGSARISWLYEPHFFAPEPWTIQVQVAESDVFTANWTPIGMPLSRSQTNATFPVTDFITDHTLQLPAGKEQNLFYRLKLIASNGATYYSPVGHILGDLSYPLWLKYQEIVRKEQLRLSRLAVGNQGYFLKAMKSGTPCTACTDPNTQEQTDGRCPTCFGQRFVGGYYLANAYIYYDRKPTARHQTLNLQEGNVDDNTVTVARVLAFPFLSTYDVFVDLTSDLRFYVRKIQTLAELHSVPIMQSVELHQIPFDNIIYTYVAAIVGNS